MKILNFASALLAALLLTACGGSSSPAAIITPPPVQAQSGFSDSNLSGTYGVSYAGGTIANSQFFALDAVGTVQFDGSGHINGGTVTSYGTLNNGCQFTLSGTYSVAQSGAVTLSPLGSPVASSGCTVTSVQNLGTYSGELNSTGTAAVFAETDFASTGGFVSGSVVKQQ